MFLGVLDETSPDAKLAATKRYLRFALVANFLERAA
jgi:hypothetical protein